MTYFGYIKGGNFYENTLTTATKMFLVFVLSLLFPLASPTPILFSPSSCPLGSTQNGNFCYKPVADPNSWIYAQFDCGNQGGNLASAQSAFDNKFLVDLAKASFGSPSAFWIGGTSLFNNDSSWSWVDGSKMNYSNWASGRPRNTDSYDSIQIHVPNGNWYDTPRAANLSYICQLPNNNGSSACEAGWYYTGATNKCYKVLTNMDTFSNQRSTCLNYGGDLVSIHSRFENFAVGSLALSELNKALNTNKTEASFLIGLQYNTTWSSWCWVDGTNFTYQPNVVSQDSYNNYGALDVNSLSVKYSWFGAPSSYTYPAICESDTFWVKAMKKLLKD